jgi:ketosteroid isomerase-like protein
LRSSKLCRARNAFIGATTTCEEPWDEYHRAAFTSQFEEIRDLGESVLLLGHFEVIGRTAGIEVGQEAARLATELGQEFAQLITFRDGKIFRSEDFLSHAEALEAAGLAE